MGIFPLSRNHHPPLKNFKNKMKNFKKGEKSQVPCFLRQQRFTPLLVRSRDGGRDPESQLLGKLPGSLLSFQKPCGTQTHLNMATWIPSSRGGRPACSGSIHCCSLKEDGRPLHKMLATLWAGWFFKWVIISTTTTTTKTGCLLPSSPNFITKENHCFFHYYFLSTMTIYTLQRITHQWKAIQRILHW